MPEDQRPQDTPDDGRDPAGGDSNPWSTPAAGTGFPPGSAPSTGAYSPPPPPPSPYGAPPTPYGQQQYGPPPTPYDQQPYDHQQYGQHHGQQPPLPYGGGGYAGGPQTSSGATVVLVCGIASIVLMFTCGLGFIPAIVALVKAGRAKREILDSSGQLSGLGMITAGRITSWITIGLTLLAVAGVILFFVVAASTTSTTFPDTTGI